MLCKGYINPKEKLCLLPTGSDADETHAWVMTCAVGTVLLKPPPPYTVWVTVVVIGASTPVFRFKTPAVRGVTELKRA